MSAVKPSASRTQLWDGTVAVYLHIATGPASLGCMLDVSDAVGLADALYGAALDEEDFGGSAVAET